MGVGGAAGVAQGATVATEPLGMARVGAVVAEASLVRAGRRQRALRGRSEAQSHRNVAGTAQWHGQAFERPGWLGSARGVTVAAGSGTVARKGFALRGRWLLRHFGAIRAQSWWTFALVRAGEVRPSAFGHQRRAAAPVEGVFHRAAPKTSERGGRGGTARTSGPDTFRLQAHLGAAAMVQHARFTSRTCTFRASGRRSKFGAVRRTPSDLIAASFIAALPFPTASFIGMLSRCYPPNKFDCV